MKKNALVGRIARLLEDSGYSCMTVSNMHASFDILAQKNSSKYIIKIEHNIDAVNQSLARDMSGTASFMDAEPVVIGSVSKRIRLSGNAAHRRMGVKCMSMQAFEGMINGVEPLLASKYVGAKAEIDGSRVRYLRKLGGMSASTLAAKANVSTDMIYKYEKSGGYASIRTIERIEAEIGRVRADSAVQDMERPVAEKAKLGKTGMKAVKLAGAPFSMIAKSRNYYEASLNSNHRTMAKKAEMFKSLVEGFDRNYPFFVSEGKSGSFHGIAVISRRLLSSMESEDELIEKITGNALI